MKQAEYKLEDDTIRIKLPEELDHNNSIDIRKIADTAIYSGKVKNVKFDFSNTVFMDSSGIGMIMGRYRLVSPLGGRITVTGAKGNIERIIKLSGLHKIVEESEEM